MQIGHGTYLPRHARYFRFTTGETMLKLYRAARVVVAHGGASAAEILREGTPLIAVPRLASRGEHIDDHQLDFVRAMERRALVMAIYDIDKLEEAVRHTRSEAPTLQEAGDLIAALRRCLQAFEAGGRS